MTPARDIPWHRANFDHRSILNDPERRTSGTLAHRVVGALTALGYPVWWQEDRIGRARGTLAAVAPDAAIPDDGLMRDILGLAVLHTRTAAPHPRLPAAQAAATQARIDATIAEATRQGHRPPGDYDENWEPLPEPVPRTPARLRNAENDAARRLAMLHQFVAHGGSESFFEKEFGHGCGRTLTRARQSIGLKVDVERQGHLNAVSVAPGQRALVQAVKAAWEQFDGPEGVTALVAWARLLEAADKIKAGADGTVVEAVAEAAPAAAPEPAVVHTVQTSADRRRAYETRKRAERRLAREAAAAALARREEDIGPGGAELTRTNAVHLVATLPVEPESVTRARVEVLRAAHGDGKPQRRAGRRAPVREHAEAV